MHTRLNYHSFIIILILCLSISTCACDEFEGGIDYHKWAIQPNNTWTIDYKNHCIGNNSIKSTLNSRETSSISTISIGGPSTVYWNWKVAKCIDGGSNSLEFLDNGNPTGYIISSENNGGYWANCTYDIKDAGRHELKWVHHNIWGINTTAWIDGLCVTSPLILFKNQNVKPETEISIIPELKDFFNLPNSSYNVEISTELPCLNITLFSKLPGEKDNCYGSKSIDVRNNTARWINKKLYCRDTGEGIYWFEARFEASKCNQSQLTHLIPSLDPRVYETLKYSNLNPIISDIFYGPNITHVFLDASYANRVFHTTMKGYTPILVQLLYSDDLKTWKLVDGTMTQKYTSLGQLQDLGFIVPGNDNDPLAKYYQFMANGKRY